MAIDRDGDQVDLELEELFRNFRNTTGGTASITPGSGTNGQNLQFSDLVASQQFVNNAFVGDTAGSYRTNTAKEARVGTQQANYATDTVDPIFITTARHKGRFNSGTGTPAYGSIPTSLQNVSLTAYRNVSESSFIINDFRLRLRLSLHLLCWASLLRIL